MRHAAAFAAVPAALILGSLARPAAASPEDIFGYGDRSPAMGGTGVAWSEGFEAAYTNPALLSRIRHLKLTLGYQEASFDLHADGAELPGTLPYDGVRSVVIGADLPIPLGGVLRDRLGAALALATPTDLVVRGHVPYPEVAQYPLLPDRAQSVTVRAGLGLDLGWGIRVGGGFAALAQLQGGAVVGTDATGHVGANVQDQLAATYSPTIGVSFDLPLKDGETTRLGVTYRGELAARVNVTIDARHLSSLNLPVFTIAGLAQYDPTEVAFEAARTFGPLLIAAGATYKHWSAYPGLLEAALPCPADDPACGALVPPKIAFHDTLVPRLGLEYRLAPSRAVSVPLRLGALYEPTPLPRKLPSSQAFDLGAARTVDVPTRYFDANRLAITAGCGVALHGPLPPFTIDAYGQVHALFERTQESDAPDTPSGPFRSVGRASGTVLAAGILAGVAF